MRRLGAVLAVGVGCLAALLAAPAGSEQAGSGVRSVQEGYLDVGTFHACAVLQGGKVRCWGSNNAGLGYGNTAADPAIGDDETPEGFGPVNLGPGRTAQAISAGSGQTCAVLDDGSVRCWGDNSQGQLGYGNTATQPRIGDDETPEGFGPVNLGPGRTARAISGGGSHTCALLDDGSVRCWGRNGEGQLGYGNSVSQPRIGDNETPEGFGPVNLGPGRTARAISAGGSHTCALLDDGSVRCWGDNGQGQLGYGHTAKIGDNETPDTADPVNLGPGRTARAISAGGSFTCALLDDGSVRCWGENLEGELGYGNTAAEPAIGDDETPEGFGPVNLGPGRTAVAISAGDFSSCALLDNGSVRCWGRNAEAQLGYGNSAAQTRIGDNETPEGFGPVNLGAGRSGRAISVGGDGACALLDSSSVRCWGENINGMPGYGNFASEPRIGDDETPELFGPVNLGGDIPGSVGDLSLLVAGSESQRLVGEQVTFTITLGNAGPDPGSGIAVAAGLPDGLAFVSAAPGQGTYDPASGLWQVGALAGGSQATLTVTATATRAGTRTVVGEVASAGLFDPDSTPANAAAGEDDRASASVAVSEPPSTAGTGGGTGAGTGSDSGTGGSGSGGGGTGGSATDTTAPSVVVTAPRSLKLAALVKGFKATATPSEPSALTFELVARARGANIAAVRDLVLGFSQLRLAAGKRSVKLKPVRALLGKPRKPFSVRVRIAATDAAGNSRVVTKTIKVTPPKRR